MMKTAFRAEILDCCGDPHMLGAQALRHYADGVMVVENGYLHALGNAEDILPTLSADTHLVDYRGKWIIPGLVDTHIHYAQSEVMASYGTQLLDWLNRYTFPAEQRMEDAEFARKTARFFCETLLSYGTTTAMIFGTVHADSVDALFEVAGNQRLIAGKVMMDRHAPESLRDTADSAYRESKALIEKWHGKSRFQYALTPRFAPTSSEAQLAAVQALLQEYPEVYVQTHVAENADEVAWVAELFPWSRSYLDVYARYDMLTPRSIFAHCLHLDEVDRQLMGTQDAVMSFCPTSNLFLGSGLFDYAAAKAANVRVGLATDVGGGTSFSLLQTFNEAYKVLQMRGQKFSAIEGFYMLTLGGAKALSLDDCIGNFEVGKEADFVVVDPNATPVLARRQSFATTLDERLFSLMMMGDDRVVYATYLMGEKAHERKNTAL